MEEAAEDWFVREILPHEAALTRYIGYLWRDPAEVSRARRKRIVSLELLEDLDSLKLPP